MPESPKDSEQPPFPDFLSISSETAGAVAALQHENRLVRMEEAFRALVELRRRFAGFSKRIVVNVYVPQCEGCYADERHRFRADEDTWKPPSITASNWRRDLREYGVTERELGRLYRESKKPGREEPLVSCRTCGGEVRYGKDNIYVHGVPFEIFFPELVGSEDRTPPREPPVYVRELVYRVYDGKCARCGTHLGKDGATMDHILPKHVGGPGTLENIQLACEPCNNQHKGGDVPEDVHVWLDFLLVPPGPEFREYQRLAAL